MGHHRSCLWAIFALSSLCIMPERRLSEGFSPTQTRRPSTSSRVLLLFEKKQRYSYCATFLALIYARVDNLRIFPVPRPDIESRFCLRLIDNALRPCFYLNLIVGKRLAPLLRCSLSGCRGTQAFLSRDFFSFRPPMSHPFSVSLKVRRLLHARVQTNLVTLLTLALIELSSEAVHLTE